MLRNTVNASFVHGGEKVNVIPCEITIDLDGRVLPGYGPDDLIAELRQVAGPEVEIALVSYDPGPAEPEMGLFGLLAGVLRQVDPAAIPTPLLLSATTDARFFSRLGIQTYGFTPMQLPADFDFSQVLHCADERVPVEAVEFGARAIYEVIRQMGGVVG
jgi:acetylornithine deacetylase/succinyl-diaminopimelate desuccinylase-like protein